MSSIFSDVANIRYMSSILDNAILPFLALILKLLRLPIAFAFSFKSSKDSNTFFTVSSSVSGSPVTMDPLFCKKERVVDTRVRLLNLGQSIV